VKRWITNAVVSKYYTVMAVTDPAAGANGISAPVLEDTDEGFSFGAPEHKLGIKGSPTRELYFDNCEIPADRRRRRRLQDRAAHFGPYPDHDRRAGPGHRPGCPRFPQIRQFLPDCSIRSSWRASTRPGRCWPGSSAGMAMEQAEMGLAL
jgi:hypothetical protein